MKLFARFEGTREPIAPALFRIAFFGGLLLHFAPALTHLDDAYAPGALRSEEWNHWLFVHFTHFPRGAIAAAAWITLGALTAGMIGLRPRIAAAISFAGCYSFASFNGLPVQTLALINAWALLFLFAICGGGSSALSIDSLFRRSPEPRLFSSLALLQTLLVVFFSGIEKLLAGWPFRDEMGILFSYPRGYLLRDWLAGIAFPHFVTASLTWATVLIELGTPIAIWFFRRRTALVIYQLFFLGIVAALEVPPLFYLMFAGAGLLAMSDRSTDRD